jgi:hypothetical protein
VSEERAQFREEILRIRDEARDLAVEFAAGRIGPREFMRLSAGIRRLVGVHRAAIERFEVSDR